MITTTVFAQGVGEGGGDKVSEKKLDVVLGIDKVIKLDYVPYTKITVGNPAVLDYQIIPQKREVVFQGLRKGKTSVIIRDTIGDIRTKYRLEVTTNSQSQVVSELREFLGDVEGLAIGIKGGKVFLGGEIVVPKDIGKNSKGLRKL